MYLVATENETYAQAFVREVNNDLMDVKRSFIKIGFRLTEADKYEYYSELGYQNITELAEAEFGFKSSTTYELMKVYALAHDRDNPMYIAKEYDKYSYSQLLALTYLKYSGAVVWDIVQPTDSVRDLKRFVSNWNEEYRNGCGYHPELKTVKEYLQAYDEKHLKAEIAETSEYAGLPGQIAIAEEPEELEEYSERSEKIEPPSGVTKESAAPMTDSDLIKYCLKSRNSESKFRIVRCQAEFMRVGFVNFIKDEYGTGGFGGPNEPYKSVEYSKSGGYTIYRATGGKIVLTWSVASGYISRMIESDEYMTAAEKEQYKQWQAEYDGFAVSVATQRKYEEPEEAKNFSERSEKPVLTNIAYLRTLCCNDIAKLIAKQISTLPETFGEGMPYEERVCKWLRIWLMLAPTFKELE